MPGAWIGGAGIKLQRDRGRPRRRDGIPADPPSDERGRLTRAIVYELLVYRFGAGASFEGQLVGAIQRIESGDGIRVRDAMFLANFASSFDSTGDVVAATLATAGPGGARGTVYSLLSFRLDPAKQRAITDRTRESEAGAEIFALADRLEPGGALLAIVVEHVWLTTLGDAVERAGGTAVAGEHVDADSIAALLPRIAEVTGLGA